MTSDRPNQPPSFAAMPFYFGDFLSSTQGWPFVAQSAYALLLLHQWSAGGMAKGVLSSDPRTLQKLIHASSKQWQIIWTYCESKFPELPGGGRQNARLEVHREKAVQRYMAKRLGANKTNKMRWANGSLSDSNTGSLSDD
ncbi:MAG TPA: DUF1376 domain-containing protein [Steroidobacteraceae bacterium]|nr:DUF1376 domain-containing protein [Steroidobacteraceae bacterium]